MFCFVLWNINLRAERRHFRRERTRVAGEEGKRSSVVDIDCRMRRRADLTTLVSLLAISVSYYRFVQAKHCELPTDITVLRSSQADEGLHPARTACYGRQRAMFYSVMLVYVL